MESSRCHGIEKEGERKTGERVDANIEYWDPIRNRNEAFEIVDIRGFKKLGRTGYYLVQYKPRILDADDEFPLEFPEMKGRPWRIILFFLRSLFFAIHCITAKSIPSKP